MDKSKAPIAETQHEIEVKTAWASLITQTSQCSSVPLDKAVQLAPGIDAQTVLSYDAFYLRQLFSQDECNSLLAAAESFGFGITNYPKSYRGNLRLTTTDQSLSDVIWKRIQSFIPEKIEMGGNTWKAIGLNECWRLAKYHPGDVFKGHTDAYFARNSQEMSLYTVNIYMNSGYKGGRTRFYSSTITKCDPEFQVQAEAGSAVVFRQPPGKSYYHDGEQVYDGVKYLFRTDVMYQTKRQKD